MSNLACAQTSESGLITTTIGHLSLVVEAGGSDASTAPQYGSRLCPVTATSPARPFYPHYARCGAGLYPAHSGQSIPTQYSVRLVSVRRFSFTPVLLPFRLHVHHSPVSSCHSAPKGMLQAKVLLFVSQDARDRDQLQEPCSLYLNPPASSEGELADTTRYEDAHRRLQGRTLFLPDSWTNRLRHHVADATSCMAKSMPVGIGAASDNMASVTRVILCTGAVVSFFVDGVDTIRRCIIDESVAGVVGHAIVSCAIMAGNVLFLGMETPPKILAVSIPTSKPSSVSTPRDTLA